ncbi:MAG: 5-formyltetrahydrofolate cyclo-ligase, partial [Sarcina sp.]
KEMREKRKSMDSKEKKEKDELLKNSLLESEEYKNAKNIFIYVSLADEIETHNIIRRMLEDGKSVAVPKVIDSKNMKAVKINSFDDLTSTGPYGILEPSDKCVDISLEIDLAIVPGLAFETSGMRLGYGGGYYDRFLSEHPSIKKISLCYDYQVVTTVYPKAYDINVDRIIVK